MNDWEAKKTSREQTPEQRKENKLIGKSMYEYSLKGLKLDLKQERRTGENALGIPDSMTRYFNWLKRNKIRLQDIIDEELRNIIEANPEIKVHVCKA